MLFPEPVAPVIPTADPAGISRDTSFRTLFPLYEKLRFLNSMSPLMSTSSVPVSVTDCGVSRSMSLILLSEAFPRFIMSTAHPMAIIGQVSIVR